MNKKGFTLIELLAVIIILSILLIISVPKVIKIIDDSKKSTFISSVKFLEKAVQADTLISGSTQYEINEQGILSADQGKRTIKYKGKIIGLEGFKITIADSRNTLISSGYLCDKTKSVCLAAGKTLKSIDIQDIIHIENVVINKVEIPNDNCYEIDEVNGKIIGYTLGGEYNCPNNPNISSVIKGVTISEIDAYAFAWLDIVAVKIPSSVKNIGPYAFEYSLITHLELSEGLEFIEQGAFSLNPIESLIIPNTVHTIYNGAFEFNEITTLVIGSGVNIIAYDAFYDNPLTSITILGDKNRFNEDWESYGFPINLKP